MLRESDPFSLADVWRSKPPAEGPSFLLPTSVFCGASFLLPTVCVADESQSIFVSLSATVTPSCWSRQPSDQSLSMASTHNCMYFLWRLLVESWKGWRCLVRSSTSLTYSAATRAGHTPAWRGFLLVRMRHRRYFFERGFQHFQGALRPSRFAPLCADVVHHSPKLRMFSNLCRSLYAPHRSTVAHSSTNWLVAIGRGPHQQDSKNHLGRLR